MFRGINVSVIYKAQNSFRTQILDFVMKLYISAKASKHGLKQKV